jgi:hypothetical protein
MKFTFTIVAFFLVSDLLLAQSDGRGNKITEQKTADSRSTMATPDYDSGTAVKWLDYGYKDAPPLSDIEDYPRPGLTPFEFNQPKKAESYPFISADGLHLLYVHNQSSDWIFYCHRSTVSAAWSVPLPLEFEGIPELDGGYEKDESKHARLTSAAFYGDENTLFVSGNWDGIFRMARLKKSGSKTATYKLDKFIEFEDVNGAAYTPGWLSNMSFCEKFGEMYAYIHNSTVCFKEVSDGIYRWQYELLNEPYTIIGKVTPDGLGFVTSLTDEGWGGLILLKRESGEQQFSMSNAFVLFQTTNDLLLLQPAYCPATRSVFLVENKMGGWAENNLYSMPVDIDVATEPYVPSKSETVFAEEDVMPPEPILVAVADLPRIDTASIPVKTMEHKAVLQVSDGTEAFKIAIGRPFPNPTSAIFHIYYQSLSADATDKPVMHINDLSGKTVLTMSLEPGNHAATVDLSKLPAGTYSVSAVIGSLQSPAERVVLIK